MRDFHVVSLSKPLCDTGMEIVIASVGELYNSVTFKHKRRMQLNLVCEAKRVSLALNFAEQHQIEDMLQLISYDENEKYQIPLGATTLLLPSEKRIGRLVRESLSKDIPVISYVNESVSEYIDHTCGVFIRPKSFSQTVEDFSKTLRILYFDPEVRKLFHQGARKRFQEISGVKNLNLKTRKMYKPQLGKISAQ